MSEPLLGEGSIPRKRILYYGPSQARFVGLLNAMAQAQGCQRRDCLPSKLLYDAFATDWAAETDGDAVVESLSKSYISLLILDLRCGEDELCGQLQRRRALTLLDRLEAFEDLDLRYGFHRILVLVSDQPGAQIDALLLELGARGIRHALRDSDLQGDQSSPELGRQVLDHLSQILRARRLGKTALCAAGGGITGIFFELGALKCLSDCLPPAALNRFDLYFGISAGAIISSVLAAGYSVEEFMAAVAGLRLGRVPPLDLRLFRLAMIDRQAAKRRLFSGIKLAVDAAARAVTKGRLPTLEQVFFEYANLVGPPFTSDRFEEMLRACLEVPGATNDFRKLHRKLYLGATDQDDRQHVLFGDEANDEIPISRAAQASLSLNPAFTATRIRGRYYEDGAVTRTSHFPEAIARGADFVLLLDPFAPYVSKRAGFSDARGILYNVDQNVRTISYTRYEGAKTWVQRRHPEVSAYTFLPSNSLRGLLSVNPFDHRPFLEIWQGAYMGTLKRIKRIQHRLEGDLRVRGLKLDTTRAEAIAARLAELNRPVFADFFLDGRVEIPTPPLCLEPDPAPAPQPLWAPPRPLDKCL